MQTAAGAPLPLERTEVDAQLGGPLAEVHVVQRFRNPFPHPIEATYLFPLGHEAAVHGLRFTIEGRVVEGVIKEKEEARKVYEQARAAGQAASLLEQEKPNLFSMAVANIPAGAVIEVSLSYHEQLAYDDGELRFVFPMAAADGFRQAPIGGPRPHRARAGEPTSPVVIRVELWAGGEIDAPRSPSHELASERLGPGVFHLGLAAGEVAADRDFVLTFRPSGREPRPLVYLDRRGGLGTFLLVVTPPAGDEAGALAPQDVVILVDRSFSMRGATAQARRAVRYLLEGLPPGSKAQVVAFDHERLTLDGLRDGAEGPKRLSTNDLPAPPGITPRLVEVADAIERADSLLAGSPARGGTEIEQALWLASGALQSRGEATQKARGDRPKTVVLITDGAIGNEVRLFRVLPRLLGDARLYVLGVGAAVNRYVVARLARAGRGASDTVMPGEDVELALARFRRRVLQAGPVLTNLSLSWPAGLVADVFPAKLPDLFGGQPLVAVGRYAGEGSTTLTIEGQHAAGGSFRQEVSVELPARSEDHPGLERLWARRRIDDRTEHLEKHPEDAASVRLEVLGLALRHSLTSPYTSLVAVDSEKPPERPAGEPPRVEVPTAEVAALEDDESEDLSAPVTRSGTVSPAAVLRARKLMAGAASGERGKMISLDDAPYPSAPALAAAPASPAFGAPPAAFAPPPAAAGFGPPPPAPGYGPPPAGPGGGGGGEVLFSLKELMHAEEEDMRSVMAPGAAPSTGAPPPPASPVPPMSMGAPMAAPAMVPPADSFMDAMPLEASRGGGAFAEEKPAPKGGFLSKALEAVSSVFRHAPAATPEAPPEPSPQAAPSKLPDPGISLPGDPYPQEILAWAKGRPIGELDLVFLVDETGSMGAYIAQVQEHILRIIAALEHSPLCTSLRVGFVGYRDHPPQDSSFASRVFALTHDVAAIKRAVAQLAASGGGDGPESVTDGLFELPRLDWRPRATRTVVWMGDAPPHGLPGGASGDGFPQGCPCGHLWATQAESCREMGITIHAVGCLPTLAHYVGAEAMYRDVASITRGRYLALQSAPLLVPIILGVAEDDLDRQRIDEAIAETIAAHRKELEALDDEVQITRLTALLQARGVRPRKLVGQAEDLELRFRDIEPGDVWASLGELDRQGRLSSGG
jgi:Ca-activated chloride channel family protein